MLISTALLIAALAAQNSPDPGTAYFHAGVRLESSGAPLRTGWFGHAAPELFDLEGDGDLDLLVGQYDDGVVRIHRNVGTDAEPVYRAEGLLQAGGEDAKVPTFCCVGFTPQLVDFNGDSIPDLLSGSYPGPLYFFPGRADRTFGAGELIRGADGEPLIPGKATTAHAVDLDGDGDLDLLSSLKRPGVAVAYNSGTPESPRFEAWEELLVDGKPVEFQYSGPVVVDFDGDGLLDLLVVRERNLGEDVWRADAFFCKNVARTGKPRYQAPVTILEDHPGLRLKILPVDYDRDGLLDFLVGDMDANCAQKDYTGYVWFFRRKPAPDGEGNEDQPVRIGLKSTGEELLVDLKIGEHWHLSGPDSDGGESVPTSVRVGHLEGVEFLSPVYPEPKLVERFGELCAEYEGEIRIRIPFERAPGTSSSTAEVTLEYQCCGDETKKGVCLLPRKRVLRAEL